MIALKEKNFTVLDTPEAEIVGTDIPYPRPQLRRSSFFSLDGLWDFSARQSGKEAVFDRQIRVPFPPESKLSGIRERFENGTELCYRRTFRLPADFCRARTILHIGAADQVTRVWLNGHFLGEHKGGYLPFSFDASSHLLSGENLLLIRVTDELDRHILPWGKQKHKRGGMWYTPVSGIWQACWLESVPEAYVKSLEIKADETGAVIRAEGVDEGMLIVRTPEGLHAEKMRGGTVTVKPHAPRLWSPEDPYLYHFRLICGEDEVHSYFACRSLSVKEYGGIKRLCLNGKPYFFHGLLDQGYFPDGIFTPAHPVRYERDILFAKSAGFNTLRKHIKIEPEQFYYDCDRLGMIVFQDMVNNGDYSFLRDTALPTLGFKHRNDKKLHKDPATRKAFSQAMQETVRALQNHPSICYWTIFNEGWGQFDGNSLYHALRALDDTRFIDTASGWFEVKNSDVDSPHVYFKPVKCRPEKKPMLLSEFGGYSLAVKGHVTSPDRVYGYRKFEDEDSFRKALLQLYREEILPAARAGLSGAIYTQLTDIEDEINGLMTSDRRHVKIDVGEMAQLAKELIAAATPQESI